MAAGDQPSSHPLPPGSLPCDEAGWRMTRTGTAHWTCYTGWARAACGREVEALGGEWPRVPQLCCTTCRKTVPAIVTKALILEVLGPEALDFMDPDDRR